MVEVMRGDFSEYHLMQIPVTQKQMTSFQMIGEGSSHLDGLSHTSDSSFIVQSVEDLIFACDEVGSAGNPIAVDKDLGFSETMMPQKTPP